MLNSSKNIKQVCDSIRFNSIHSIQLDSKLLDKENMSLDDAIKTINEALRTIGFTIRRAKIDEFIIISIVNTKKDHIMLQYSPITREELIVFNTLV